MLVVTFVKAILIYTLIACIVRKIIYVHHCEQNDNSYSKSGLLETFSSTNKILLHAPTINHANQLNRSAVNKASIVSYSITNFIYFVCVHLTFLLMFVNSSNDVFVRSLFEKLTRSWRKRLRKTGKRAKYDQKL